MSNVASRVAFESRIVALGEKPVYHYIQVEKALVTPLELAPNFRRVICTVNGMVTFPCSLLGDGKGGYLIMINKVNREKAGAEPGLPAQILLVRDTSKYGLPMPKELREVLKQDRDGRELFEGTTKGRQRSIIYFVTRARDVDTRIHYALVILEHLKKNDGRIVEKELMKELRRPAF
jgi:hypothetical protein